MLLGVLLVTLITRGKAFWLQTYEGLTQALLEEKQLAATLQAEGLMLA